jgi:hypothetical protein
MIEGQVPQNPDQPVLGLLQIGQGFPPLEILDESFLTNVLSFVSISAYSVGDPEQDRVEGLINVCGTRMQHIKQRSLG